ncbi:MAG TPA: 2-hydroxychromene-2-carboxylate isomerase [Solimonas sp.]|nr:2-hydroxychromene-2-carboxylate isomerase [Solimonas sp.]
MFDDPQKLYFFFDYISHNAWLAWNRAPALAQRHGLVLEPVPVLFAGLLNAHGQKGPAEVPAKSRWMLWNVLRKARQLGIDLAPPHSHPFNPLLALRLSCCALPAPQRLALIEALFRATWAESRPVSEAEALRPLLAETGLDADTWLSAASSEPAKSQLRDNTDAAVAAGVFGVPAMRVRGELFWGFDDLEYLELFLQGADPLGADRSAYQDWLYVRPSAQRLR